MTFDMGAVEKLAKQKTAKLEEEFNRILNLEVKGAKSLADIEKAIQAASKKVFKKSQSTSDVRAIAKRVATQLGIKT